MAGAEDKTDQATMTAGRGRGLKKWAAVVAIAAIAGGAGFAGTFTGIADSLVHQATEDDQSANQQDVPRFLELDPMTITVGDASSARQLRFRAFLALGEGDPSGVAALQPRILDIFATYLRAVSVERLEDPTALLHLRAQLLRRVQLLVGADAVTDLLVIDFVIA